MCDEICEGEVSPLSKHLEFSRSRHADSYLTAGTNGAPLQSDARVAVRRSESTGRACIPRRPFESATISSHGPALPVRGRLP